MQHNFWLAKSYGLASQKLCYIRMRWNIEKSGEQDKEGSLEWLVSACGPRSWVVLSAFLWLVYVSFIFRYTIINHLNSAASLVLVKPRKDMNNVRCRRDMTEMLLKSA